MKNRSGLLLMIGFFLMASCKSDYDKLVRSELKSGVINKELIFGLEMGQEKKEFYNICWKLNSQKMVSQGPSNEMVRYMIKPEEIEGETEEKVLAAGAEHAIKAHGLKAEEIFLKIIGLKCITLLCIVRITR